MEEGEWEGDFGFVRGEEKVGERDVVGIGKREGDIDNVGVPKAPGHRGMVRGRSYTECREGEFGDKKVWSRGLGWGGARNRDCTALRHDAAHL